MEKNSLKGLAILTTIESMVTKFLQHTTTAKAEPYRVVSVNIEAKKENRKSNIPSYPIPFPRPTTNKSKSQTENDEDYAISAKVQLEQEIGIKTWDDALNYRMATSEEAEQSFPGPE